VIGEEERMSIQHEYLLRCHPELARYARSLMASAEDASDLVQEVGVVVLAHEGAPTDARAFLGWCRRIAHNLALHHWRAARRHHDIFSAWDPEQDCSEAAGAAVDQLLADRQALARCIGDLDSPSRKLLELRYVDGKSSAEIARILGQSPGAVRMRIMRLREAILREAIRDNC
jgi:RNA polymerase sigma-70 factor (ECF subfamily)